MYFQEKKKCESRDQNKYYKCIVKVHSCNKKQQQIVNYKRKTILHIPLYIYCEEFVENMY